VSLLRAALSPDFTLEHVIADEDKVAVMERIRGTQLADWMGAPATGKSFDIEGVDVYLFRDGLLAEHWHVVDVFSMLIQLGHIPAPAGASA
jgi:predicted ester cyclase